MDKIPLKKVKLENPSSPEPLTNIDDSNSKNTTIDKLNFLCLAKVFMYIPVLERLEMAKVCQKWKETIDLSWNDVKSLDFNDSMIPLDKKEQVLKKIVMKCGRFLTHLKISGFQYPWMSNTLKNNCQNVIHFEINMKKKNVLGFKIPDKDLVEIIENMTKLKYLKVFMNMEGSTNLCNEILDKLPGDMKEIHFISEDDVYARRVSQVHQKPVPSVLDKFTALQGFTLIGFILENSTINSILQNKKTLIKLDLSDCVFPSDGQPIFSHLKNLEHLILDSTSNFNITELVAIGHCCSKLKHFEFSVRGPSNGESYLLFKELKHLNLEHLDFPAVCKCNNSGKDKISGISDNWKKLKHLYLGGGYKFSIFDIQELTEFKNLEYLNLCEAKINSQAFINIASNCLELRELVVPFEEISEAALGKLTNLKKLEKIDFEKYENLTGNLLCKIVKNCKNLEDVNLSGCQNLSEYSLIKLGELKNLKKLNVTDIPKVPNGMFDDFCKLEYLSCNNCPSVTDEGIKKVIDNCRKLAFLKVRKTGVTFDTLVHASKRQFVFTQLFVDVDLSVKNEFVKNICKPSVYLTIV